MYQAHFGLNELPFGITPNPAFFYEGNTRGEILQALLYVVMQGEGIIKVTGEVGSGKTMLCRMLESQLPAHIEVIYLVNPSLSPIEALFAIAGELGLDPDGKRSDEVLRELHADLIAKHSAGKQVVLLVEEAQAMPLPTLEEIRLLTNLETAHHKLLQIVLFGQPELDEHLNLPSMRQLKERITHSFEVPAMAPDLVPEFLAHRLRAAGYDGPAIFSAAASRQIAKVSRGIVRRINILADKALLAAFAADSRTVQLNHAREAIQESPFKQRFSGNSIATVALLLLIALLLGGIAWLMPRQPAGSAVPARVAAPAPVAAAQHTATGQPGGAQRPAAQAAPSTAASSPAAGPAAAAAAAATSPAAAPAASATAAVAPAAAAAATVVPATVAAATVIPATVAAAAKASSQPAAATPSQARAGASVPGTLSPSKLALRSSKIWLRDAPSGHMSLLIETMPASEQARLDRFLLDTSAAIGLNEVHAYPRRVKNPDSVQIAIVYGSFAKREQAETMQKLLSERFGYLPQIQEIGKIRSEVAAAGLGEIW